MVSLRRIVTATTLVLGSMLMQAQATAPAKPATSAPQKSISQKIADDQNKLDINTATPDQLKAIHWRRLCQAHHRRATVHC
jgi:hypothetical protein